MSTQDTISLEGVITKLGRGGIFNVDVNVGDPPHDKINSVVARCSGKMKKFKIQLTMGDKVEIEFSPYDLTQGRIVRRKPNK